jgi:hypothetical protein
MFASSQGWDAVQESFWIPSLLLRNYRKYLVFPSKHNEGYLWGAGFRSRNTLKVNDTICVTFGLIDWHTNV